jgi:hypothetical protein
MSLYTVNFVGKAVVLADSGAEAIEATRKLLGNHPIHSDLLDFEAQELDISSDLPGGWDGDCLPYGSGMLTIDDILQPDTKKV